MADRHSFKYEIVMNERVRMAYDNFSIALYLRIHNMVLMTD